ncbi:hypothetical protein BGZ80_004104 [Entomortierella chlamydospora]|uniref:Uncharacterized protein n=1 Tax=Entomortierella chlamydospora TaxID=101097 RepID=A0A9P6N1K5_9FUNG|nr:hypothetical protein BGZ80_004104 [Entomortierella chlamydospora]
MPSSAHALLPEAILSLLSSKSDAPSTMSSDSMTLKAQLKRIPRSKWLRLGSECHNAGFASDAAAALKSHKPAVSSVSIFSTAATAARAAALLYDSGIPRILGTIVHRQAAVSESSKELEQEQGSLILWSLYKYCKLHCAREGNIRSLSSKGGKSRSTYSTSPPIDQKPWQLEFLKSACPEVVVIAFADAYIEYGPRHGFERDLPTDLIEALDFEWRSNSGLSKRAVLALIQTLIACRRYVKNNSSIDAKQATTKGLGSGPATSVANSTDPVTDENNSVEQSRNEQEHEKACHQLALTMAEACVALEVFFDTERGRNLPKLITLYQQELAADAKLQSRSGQAGAGVDRGIKRHGVGAAGAGSGTLGSTGADPMDTAARKRFKSGGNETGLIGSTPTTMAAAPPLLAPSPTPTLLSAASPSTSSGHPTASSTTLKTSSHFVDQALTGYSSAVVTQTTPAAATSSSANAQQLAKLNNPLWSPVMGLTHLPQWPTKYAAQVESELERWISLLGHMDGAVFSEKLVGLIKSVYPSDQKFLLDQILIDYMCWEGSGGREREVAEPAFDVAKYLKENIPLLVSTDGSNSVMSPGIRGGGGGAPNPDIKTGEWVTETIMSTLVSLVIKPEESSTFLEPGSKKWIEVIEVPVEVEDDPSSSTGIAAAASTSTSGTVAAAGFGDPPSSSGTTVAPTTTATTSAAAPSHRPSAAMGGAKKRRVRNLYNRRVSPFYAVLAMFQSKRVVGRVTGMLYSGSGELASHYDVNVGSNAGGGGTVEPGAGGVIGIDAQELLKQVGDTPAFPKLATAQTGELEEPDPDVAKLDRRRLKKQKRKEKKTLLRLRQQYQRRHGQGGDLDAEEGDDSRARLLAGGDIDIDEQLAGVEALQRYNINNDSGDVHNAEREPRTKEGEEESSNMEGIEQDTNIEAPPSPQGPDGAQQDEWIAEAAEEEDALELAKQVEASRVVCQAPLKVLMFILQYLTRANQAGALDSWITDALSATLPTLQEQYFEWMLCNMVTAKSTPQALSGPPPPLPSSAAAPSGAEANQDQGETVVFEEELLRLLSVLVAAQGIGYEPAKTALEAVERARQKVVDSLKDQEIQESSYWTRAKTLLENH